MRITASRAAAAGFLGQVGGPGNAGLLQAHTSDANPSVRAIAIRALARPDVEVAEADVTPAAERSRLDGARGCPADYHQRPAVSLMPLSSRC